ncbi:MAG: hypothetical protein FWB91_10905 [Defluviitaleaceae bacterium]|nr:hypothetical protein [Defluviitaleaceae bacterium]
MATVNTVWGEVSASELGFVDFHNHLWKEGGLECLEDHDFAIDDIAKSRKELESFVQAGGGAMVDMQCMGIGRGIEQLRAISKGLKVHVIAATGFHKGSFYDKTHFVHRYDPDQILELVSSEVLEGVEKGDFFGPFIDRSEAKAGVIKCGSSYYKITALEEKLIRVNARASKKTGCPISTHTQMGTMGLEQAQILKSEGVEPEKICIGHMDRDPDHVYHERVLKEGVYLQYDCIARIKYHPVIDTMELIKKLADKGYGDRIMIGGDWGRASYLKAYGGSPGMEFIPKTLAKQMPEYGISDTLINKIFVENPARFLAF